MPQAASSHACPWRAAVAILGRNDRSGDARLEVHSALPMLILHPSGANNCAAGGTGVVLIQGDRGASTFGVVRAYRLCGVARRVSRGPKRVEIGQIADEPDLHITPFRSAPINIRTSVSPHARGIMLQAAASDERPWVCCRDNTQTKEQLR